MRNTLKNPVSGKLKITFALLVLITWQSGTSVAQLPNTWSQKANYGGGLRNNAIGFSIGDMGYLGTGNNGSTNTSDFWQFNPATNSWTQRANYGGGVRRVVTGFSIGDKGYIGTGDDGISKKTDFWEYDTANNKWTQRANIGGSTLYGAVGFSIGTKGYISTGHDGSSTYKNTLWEYNPSSNSWTQKANFPGSARYLASGFGLAGKGYLGTGHNGVSQLKDFWQYNPSTNSWTQKTDFPGVARNNCVAFSIANRGYLGAGYDGSTDRKDFWEYNPANNSWTAIANFGGNGKRGGVGFSTSSKGYVGTGMEGSSSSVDFWEYTPICHAENSSLTDTACRKLISPSGKFTWTSSGTYMDTLLSVFGCDSILTLDLTVVEIDTNISVSGNSLFANASLAFYQWLKCGDSLTPIAGATSKTYSPDSSGEYAVEITMNGCADTSVCVNFIKLGIGENERRLISVFPNPAEDQLTVSIQEPLENAALRITDSRGRTVFSMEEVGKTDIQIDISTWNRTLYLLKITGSGKSYTYKLVLQ